MKLSTLVILLTSCCTLGYVNYLAFSQYALRHSADSVFLELAPIDPLSLFTGQYMNVSFSAEGSRLSVDQVQSGLQGGAVGVFDLDDRGIGELKEVAGLRPTEEQRRAWNEKYGLDGYILFQLRVSPARRNLKPDSDRREEFKVYIDQRQFSFEENTEYKYRDARYGFFRVQPNGQYTLIDLADANLRLLSPQSASTE